MRDRVVAGNPAKVLLVRMYHLPSVSELNLHQRLKEFLHVNPKHLRLVRIDISHAPRFFSTLGTVTQAQATCLFETVYKLTQAHISRQSQVTYSG
jgi:hypothetical protein